MMNRRHHYLEVRKGDQVIKRIATSLASEYRHRSHLELFKKSDQEIYFISSSEKEKVIN